MMMEKPVVPTGKLPVQFTIMIGNHPGALSAILILLKKEGICPLGLCLQDCHEIKFARLIVNDEESTSALFMKKGIPFTTNEILVIAVNEGPEYIPEILEQLFVCETVVSVLYPLFPHPDNYSLTALSVDDPHFARGILHANGVKIMMSEDLSR